MNSTPIFRSVADTANCSGESKYAIRKMIREGKVHYLRNGNRYLVHYPKFLNYIESCAEEIFNEPTKSR